MVSLPKKIMATVWTTSEEHSLIPWWSDPNKAGLLAIASTDFVFGSLTTVSISMTHGVLLTPSSSSRLDIHNSQLFWEDWMSVEQKSLRDFDSRRTSFLIPSRDLNKRNPDWLLEPKIFLRLLYSFPLYKDNKKVEHFSPLLYITYILMRYTYSFIRILNYF